MDMEFLYFPEDNMEYLPAIISLIIFMIGAVVAMYLLYKKSKKEEEMIDKKYSQARFEHGKGENNTNNEKKEINKE